MHKDINENSIADMVDTFYGAIRQDPSLGPIFDAAIGGDWSAHLAKMKTFWSSVLLASRTYKGNPMLAHLNLPRLQQVHFDRWLELWSETAAALCCQEVASLFVEKAHTIGARLLHAISQYHESVAGEIAPA